MKFTIGFDAYIDKLARVVESRTDCDNYKCYATIEDFGNRVLKMKGLSGDIETITQSIRYGGNAPLMAGALSGLGADVTLVAPVGNSSCFDSIRESTNVINIGEPAESFNLEFDDGKVMMGENSVLNDINLEKLTENGFMDDIMAEFSKSGLIGFVNWSQMEKIIPVYKYIIEKLDDKERILFADLADFSKKPSDKIKEFLDTVVVDKKGLTTIIGLNENELNLMAEYSGIERGSDICADSLKVSEKINCNIVVHGIDYSLFVKNGKIYYAKGKLVLKPKLTTGGGDHFNAGFCYALFKEKEEENILRFAMGTSGAYVTDGVSPSEERVYNYLKGE